MRVIVSFVGSSAYPALTICELGAKALAAWAAPATKLLSRKGFQPIILERHDFWLRDRPTSKRRCTAGTGHAFLRSEHMLNH
ncbi:hypothetical protein [Methylosinus sp. LW3]|uniref:hypothetical protein n=1 Tax=Methylosinus sp. LW3 TaxID=107635 RepID=UPI000463DB69|nr:hypothetical protein [Methylosinus sp. LW3]